MQRLIVHVTLVLVFSFSVFLLIEGKEYVTLPTPIAPTPPVDSSMSAASGARVEECHQLYLDMELENVVNYSAFREAVVGYHKIGGKKKSILTLVDFTKPSTEKRLYVFDMDKKELLYVSHVSHGKNSGGNYAASFSNEAGSYKSSLGFYLTENTYQGRNGYSLVLNGLEKGINDRAKERAIVIHGANYCNPSSVSKRGRLGRSLGCPALPQSLARPIINTIKDKSLLYIYANDKNYLTKSSVLSFQASAS